jgi:hypothetical protein
MSEELRTKDGSFSVAGAILATNEKDSGRATIDMDGALAWARENNLNLRKTKNPMGRINSHRITLELPPFDIIKDKQSTGRSPARKKKARIPLPIVSSEDDLLERVTNFDGTLHGLVTPQIAEWLLKLNTNNRRLSRAGVERFCKILQDETWKVTGETIVVSEEGVLHDGQHRLTAIKTTGIAILMDVRFGIDPEAIHATGTGQKRTAAHVLGIEGYSHTGLQAAIARLVVHYDRGQMGKQPHVEHSEILRVVTEDDCICEIAEKIRRSSFPPARTGPFGCVLAIAARTAPLERVFEFSDHVIHGWAASAEDARPTHALHERLSDLAMKKGQRLNPIDLAVLTIKTWNAWSAGDPLPILRVTEADRSNAGFPRIRDWTENQKMAE